MAAVEETIEEPQILESGEKENIPFLQEEYFDEIYAVLESEEEQFQEEIDLFRDFWGEVKNKPVEMKTYTPPGEVLDSDELRQIYNDRVFSRENYFSESFPSLEESFEEELGAEAFEILRSGSNLNSVDKETVKQGKDSAIERRKNILQMLRSEQQYLERLENNLNSLSCLGEIEFQRMSKEQLKDVVNYTEEAENYIEDVAKERQQGINSHNPEKAHMTINYIYNDTQFTYPVLGAATETLDYIEEVREEAHSHLK